RSGRRCRTMTPHEAREFLIERITEQAERGDTPLSEGEAQMLYSSGGGARSVEFEQKLKGVIRKARAAVEENDSGEIWENAVETLRWEDPYLPRLIDLAGKPLSAGQFVRSILIPSVIIAG